jgi:hypothetical protein
VVPTEFDEEFIHFKFEDAWKVIKYDEHIDYLEWIGRLPDTKAVDFLALKTPGTLFFIEVKDFRGHRIENKKRLKQGELAVEVAKKVRDTIAGVAAARHRGKADPWNDFAQCLIQEERPAQVLLWLEGELPADPRGRGQNRLQVIGSTLKKQLRWLTTKVLVTNLASGPPDGIAVRNLPGAGQRTGI